MDDRAINLRGALLKDAIAADVVDAYISTQVAHAPSLRALFESQPTDTKSDAFLVGVALAAGEKSAAERLALKSYSLRSQEHICRTILKG